MSNISPLRREFFMGWQQERCYLCATQMTYPRAGEVICREHDATEDHIQPRCSGSDRKYNTALACWRCNNRRGNAPPTTCMRLFGHEIWSAFDRLLDEANVPPLPMSPHRCDCAPPVWQRRFIRQTAMEAAFERAQQVRS